MASKADKKAAKKGAEKEALANPFDPPQGVRDFFPVDMRRQNWFFEKWRSTALRYGFEEYEPACLEKEETFRRKRGQHEAAAEEHQEDDLVKEMYCFDSAGEKVCLRPELTASLARMLLSKQSRRTGNIELRLPLKWYSIPRCWRNETPQKGRKREFFQWNMDIIGVPSVNADAELLATVVDFLRAVGLTSNDVEIQLNSRGVIVELLASLGVGEERYGEVVRIVDKRDKFPTLAAAEQALAEIVGSDKAKRILELTHFRDLTAFADATDLHNSESVMELKHLFGLLEKSGIVDWVKFDASIARGLDYYTGVVFEAFAKDKTLEVFRAICGGGRYNRLLSVMGSSKEVPCIGFGFGDCVVYELLSALKRMPSDEALTEAATFTVVAFTDEFMGDAMHIGQLLRMAGKTVDVCLDPKVVKKKPNPKAAFEYANERVGSKYIAFVAPDELEKGMVKVKDLSAAQETQWAIPLQDLANFESFISSNAPLPPEKGGGAPSTAETPCPVGGTKKPAAAVAAAPAATAAAAVTSQQEPTAAVRDASGKKDEQWFLSHSYAGGFAPSAADRELHETLSKTTGEPSTPAFGRWYRHIASFTPSQRSEWQ